MALCRASMEVEDGTYSSTSEAEADSDHEDLEDDPDKLLGAWLGQLENLTMGLENASSGLSSVSCSSGEKSHGGTPRMDSYRFSMANLEDSHEMELDAILGELYAIENHFEKELENKRGHQRNTSCMSSVSQGLITPSSSIHNFSSHDRPSPGLANGRGKMDTANELDSEDNMRAPKSEGGARTDSPDADSAFSDTVSMLSSESSASSGGGGVARTEISSHSVSSKSSGNSLTCSPTQINAEQAARIKAEKIKIALEKIKEASIKKLFIKAYSADGSTKSLLVDEKMSVGYIAKLLADKNHVTLDHRWAIVENIPELYMERVFEDHENLVENLLLWTRDSKNRLLFVERDDKFDMFIHPERYLSMGKCSSMKDAESDEETRANLIEEFFAGNGARVPEVEGMLHLKSDGKKAWKKHYFVLRASGLYYCPKGKSKSSKDLVCLSSLDLNRAYVGVGWRKKYKAPTEFGFALKHPQIQTKTSKYIKYLCADDERCFRRWMTGIRVVKYGRQLLENYHTLQQDMAEEDLDLLAHARSFSISSVARSSGSSQCTTPSGPTTPTLDSSDMTFTGSDQHSSCSTTPASTLERTWSKRPVRRQDSIRSGSSGTVSERSGNGSPIGELCGFDAEFPTGTIKRKPSMTPKIPLTNTTRSLAQTISDENGHGGNEGSATITGTLRRTLRRSLTDDRITLSEAVQTLRRQGEARRNEAISKGKYANLKSEEGTEESSAVAVEAETVDNLPLPPPPEFAASTESLASVDSLPPPPPEAYRSSNLSLDSPPTPPAERRSSSSLNSLPPPPSPLLDTNRTIHLHRNHLDGVGADRTRMFGSLRLPSKMATVPPPPPPKPQAQRRGSETEAAAPHTPLPFLAELKAQAHSKGFATAPHPRRALSADRKNPPSQSPPAVPAKKISFRQVPLPPPLPPALLASGVADMLRPKPPPPRRSESTRLSIRSSTMSRVGTASPVTPPKTFLTDLQRVMEKKWKVAQQLKMDLGSTAHAVMGFRDPPLPDDVLCCAQHMDEREKAAAAKANTLPHPATSLNGGSCRDSIRSVTFDDARSKKKMPPPPPPKRSETTQLTTSKV